VLIQERNLGEIMANLRLARFRTARSEPAASRRPEGGTGSRELGGSAQ
jgi:hypothetical protein